MLIMVLAIASGLVFGQNKPANSSIAAYTITKR